MAFGPSTKGNGEKPLPPMCYTFLKLCPSLGSSSQYSGFTWSRSHHVAAMYRAPLKVAETYKHLMHIHGQKSFQIFIQQTDKCVHSLAFTWVCWYSFVYTLPGWAAVESATALWCVLGHIWWWQPSLICESSQSPALSWLTKTMLFLSIPFLLSPYSLYPPKENSTFAIS